MITLDNFESFVAYRILVHGEEYYEAGAVSELEESLPGEWSATVKGTKSYNVNISMDGREIVSWYCGCPLDGEICKHIVAALLAIRNHERKNGQSPQPYIDDIKQLMEHIHPQDLSQFIREYATMHPEFKKSLLSRFTGKKGSEMLEDK